MYVLQFVCKAAQYPSVILYSQYPLFDNVMNLRADEQIIQIFQ